MSVLDCLKWEHDEFVDEIFSKLKLHFQVAQDKDLPLCIFATRNMICAVLIISYFFRKHYREHYNTLRKQFHKVEEFKKFCSFVSVPDNDLHFFQILRRVSYLFELCLYLLKEGYDYFSVACKSIQENFDHECFIKAGGWETLNQVSISIMDFIKCKTEIFTVHPLLGNFIENEENNPNGINLELINKAFQAPPISNYNCNHFKKMVESFVLHEHNENINVEICHRDCTLIYEEAAICMYLKTLNNFPETELSENVQISADELSENVQIPADESLENGQKIHIDCFGEMLNNLGLTDTYLYYSTELFKSIEKKSDDKELLECEEKKSHDSNEEIVYATKYINPPYLVDTEEEDSEEEEFGKSKETLLDNKENNVHQFGIPIYEIFKGQFRDDASLPEVIPLPDKHLKVMMQIINFVSSLTRKDKIDITEYSFTPPYTADQTVVIEIMDTIPDHPTFERSNLINTFKNLAYLSIKDKNNLYNSILTDSQYTTEERNELLMALGKIPDSWEDKIDYLISVIRKLDCPQHVISQLISGVYRMRSILYDDNDRWFPVIDPNTADILLPQADMNGKDQLKRKRSLTIISSDEEISFLIEEMNSKGFGDFEENSELSETQAASSNESTKEFTAQMKQVDMMCDQFEKPVTACKMDGTNLRENSKLCEMNALCLMESTEEFARQMKHVEMMCDEFEQFVSKRCEAVSSRESTDELATQMKQIKMICENFENSVYKQCETQAANLTESTKAFTSQMKLVELMCAQFKNSVRACEMDDYNLKENSIQAASSSESTKELVAEMKQMSLTGAIPKTPRRSIKREKNFKGNTATLYGRNSSSGGSLVKVPKKQSPLTQDYNECFETPLVLPNMPLEDEYSKEHDLDFLPQPANRPKKNKIANHPNRQKKKKKMKSQPTVQTDNEEKKKKAKVENTSLSSVVVLGY